MAEVVSLIHKIQLIKERHGIRKIVFGMFRVTEGVLHPCGDRHNEVHAEKRAQNVNDSNSPIVNKHRCEESVVTKHSPQYSPSVLFIAFLPEVGVRGESQGGPNVVRKIPKEIQRTCSIVASGRNGIVGPAVLLVVETNMNRAIEFRYVAIQISEEELDVAAEDLIAFLREVTLGPVRLQVLGAEHPHKPFKLEAVKGKIESNREQEPGFT